MIRFVIPGAAVGKGRARIAPGSMRPYTPKATVNYEAVVKLAAETAMAGREPLEGPLALRVTVLKSVPVSWAAKKRQASDWVTSKPDLDNVVKALKDGMNRIVYGDDAQIASLFAVKRYADQDMVVIEVERL